jgi:hypothetical protein
MLLIDQIRWILLCTIPSGGQKWSEFCLISVYFWKTGILWKQTTGYANSVSSKNYLVIVYQLRGVYLDGLRDKLGPMLSYRYTIGVSEMRCWTVQNSLWACILQTKSHFLGCKGYSLWKWDFKSLSSNILTDPVVRAWRVGKKNGVICKIWTICCWDMSL